MTQETPSIDTLLSLAQKAKDEGRLTDSLRIAEQIRKLNPHDSRALANSGNILAEGGSIETALSYYAKAREKFPRDLRNESDFLYMLHFLKVPEELLFLEHQRFGDFAEPDGYQDMCAHPRKQSGKIRIGYLSPDMYRQASHYILEPVVANHNKSKFELYAYCTGHVHDTYTERIRRWIDVWREADPFDTETLLNLIQKDEIDILIDLAGHTGQNSLPVFARRAAPIQMSWFGYMDTSGLQNMDYRITDLMRNPAGREKFYTEKLLRLSNSYTFMPSPECPAPTSPPALKNGYTTFGSFNGSQKINPDVIKVWAQILRELPTSRLYFITPKGTEYREHLLMEFQKEGVSPSRIIPRERTTLSGFFSYLQEVDIALDPFPYTGGVTTYHALSLGVPSITLEGKTEYERNCSAILHEVGLTDFVASSTETYIQKAVYLSKNHSLLQELRELLPRELRSRQGAIVPELENALIELQKQKEAKG